MTIWIDTQVCVMAMFAVGVYSLVKFFGPLKRREEPTREPAEEETNG